VFVNTSGNFSNFYAEILGIHFQSCLFIWIQDSGFLKWRNSTNFSWCIITFVKISLTGRLK